MGCDGKNLRAGESSGRLGDVSVEDSDMQGARQASSYSKPTFAKAAQSRAHASGAEIARGSPDFAAERAFRAASGRAPNANDPLATTGRTQPEPTQTNSARPQQQITSAS